MTERLANNAQTTLAEAINDTDDPAIFDVSIVTNFPTLGNFRILVGGEIMLVTDVTGSQFTASRAQEGTTIATHSSGDKVTHILTAGGVLQFIQDTAPLPQSYIVGCELINDISSPNTIIDVSAGSCRDDNNAVNIIFAGLNKTLNNSGSWAAGNNSNGLDTGARANSTWYHVYVITKVDGSDPEVLMSTSNSSPHMPTSYTQKRRVGSIRTDSSGNILAFTQIGDRFTWATSLRDVSGASVTTTASTISLTVATGVRTIALFRFVINSTTEAILITSLAETNQALTNNNYSIVGTALGTAAGDFQKPTNTTGQIRLRATGTCTADLWTYGWIDRRGT